MTFITWYKEHENVISTTLICSRKANRTKREKKQNIERTEREREREKKKEGEENEIKNEKNL